MVVRALKILIYIYQYVLSPYMRKRCRFTPSCSHYSLECLEKHGVSGIFMAFKRLTRCHPWGGSGVDPVPSVQSYTKSKEYP